MQNAKKRLILKIIKHFMILNFLCSGYSVFLPVKQQKYEEHIFVFECKSERNKALWPG